MPRDILSDSLAVLKIVEHEDEENWPLENKPPCKQNNKKISNISLNSQKPFTKDDCACYYNYGHGDNGSSRQHDPVYQYKTSSLPPASSINQSWDEIVCSALRISPEDIANQLTLLDLPADKTWACLSKKDKQQFDKLAELFGEKDNWTALREYLKCIPLPCIPYLGIFLTDLVYIDIAHPAGSPHRIAKMAVVLKALEKYQTSEYDIAPVPHVGNYLNSVRYIEELQKFLEDDQYKLSQKLEPPSPLGSCTGSKESVKEVILQGASNIASISPSHKLGSGSLRLQGTCHQGKFIPTHRKCRSLGSNIFGKNHTDDKVEDKTPAGSVNLLDDTLLESPSSVAGSKMSRSLPHSELCKAEVIQCDFQGFVRRKTILKMDEPERLSLRQMQGTVSRWMVGENCGWYQCRLFQLINHQTGTLYKFKTVSEATARMWVKVIEEVTNKIVKPLPANLMSFE
ncbi:unnamed protein product [Arctia plantaginis]|uniref:Ras-GEF domain-containing protein n=1 Tax=Arctia plantaginis TaxID=874455 RepID=A0A8S1ATS7_ARCPL|nr:unnamed protein product [Arctia plantaginis]